MGFKLGRTFNIKGIKISEDVYLNLFIIGVDVIIRGKFRCALGVPFLDNDAKATLAHAK